MKNKMGVEHKIPAGAPLGLLRCILPGGGSRPADSTGPLIEIRSVGSESLARDCKKERRSGRYRKSVLSLSAVISNRRVLV